VSQRRGSRASEERFPTKGALHEHVRQILMLERLCSRFHAIATQLQSRTGGRATLRVEDEDDVRDLLRALLILEHEDIRPQVWTPNYAEGSPRMDFLLRIERMVVVARMARDGWGTGELKAQLAEDIQHYRERPECGTLVYFVYDPERRIPKPRGVETSLSDEVDGLTVRVIIAPKGL